MPGFDRTGPEGQGAKTGRGLGKCNSHKQEQIEQENAPRGMRGRGRRHRGSFGRGFGRGRAEM